MKYPLKRWKAVALSCLLLAGAVPALAQADDADILQAREAHARRDTQRLAALRASAAGAQHPLASWVDYWELNNRLGEATQDDLNTFYERWRGSYVEDRLRNDWLLELGRRRDWTNFRVDHPRFRMNDDRQVTAMRCSPTTSPARTCAMPRAPSGTPSETATTAARCSPPPCMPSASCPTPTSGRSCACPSSTAGRAPQSWRPKCSATPCPARWTTSPNAPHAR